MPLYYFHVHDGMSYPDDRGMELSSPAEAKNMALHFVGDLAKLYSDRIIRGESLIVDVSDDQQKILFTLQLNINLVGS